MGKARMQETCTGTCTYYWDGHSWSDPLDGCIGSSNCGCPPKPPPLAGGSPPQFKMMPCMLALLRKRRRKSKVLLEIHPDIQLTIIVGPAHYPEGEAETSTTQRGRRPHR